MNYICTDQGRIHTYRQTHTHTSKTCTYTHTHTHTHTHIYIYIYIYIYTQWRRHGVVWGSCNYPTLKKSTHTICLNPRSFFRGGGVGVRVWRRKQGELSSLQHSIKIVLGDRLI